MNDELFGIDMTKTADIPVSEPVIQHEHMNHRVRGKFPDKALVKQSDTKQDVPHGKQISSSEFLSDQKSEIEDSVEKEVEL